MSRARRDPEQRDSTEALAVGRAIVQRAPLTSDDFDRLRSFIDPDASLGPDDFYGFRMIAASDGLDFYFTRQAASSLDAFAGDLEAGQALLAAHDINTMPYGQSYAGVVDRADPEAAYYESMFYKQYADQLNLATNLIAVGSYYIPRGITLNGQPTDDLIRSIEAGVNRKASVSFTVGRYVCGLDGQTMLDFGWGPYPDPATGCNHYPGVEYPDGVAWAWMEDCTLLETSLVYKNASPSAMLVRRAEDLARAGALPTRAIPALEQRLQVRLPARERRLHAVSGKETPTMATRKRHATDDETPAASTTVDDTDDETTDETLEDTAVDETETGQDALEDVNDDDTDDEGDDEGDATGGDAESRHSGHSHDGPTKGGHKRKDKDGGDDALPDPLDDDEERVVRAIAAADRREIERLIGGRLTVGRVRTLVERAALGDQLFGDAIEEAVRLRIAVQRETFDAEGYRKALRAVGTLEYVKSEQKAWRESRRLTAGRQVDPGDVRDDDAGTQATTGAPIVDLKAAREAGRQPDGSLLAQPRRQRTTSTSGTSKR